MLKTRKWIVISLLVLVLLAGASWYLVRGTSDVSRVKALQKELFSPEARNLPADERQEKRKELGELIRGLSPAQRRELFADRQKKMEEKLDRFFKLPRKDQIAELDREIKRMSAVRKKWESKASAAGRNAGQANGRPNPQGAWGGRPPSADEKEQRRKNWLDGTTPVFRAELSQYRQMMRNRMQQLGIMPGKGFWKGP
jgi:hypothetical protein